jgi:hypothetical protein
MPSWVPGAGFQKLAVDFRGHLMEFINSPFEFVRTQMVWNIRRMLLATLNCNHEFQEAGTAESSFVHRHLESNKFESEEQQCQLKWTAGGLYAGGADTVG